MIFSTTSSVKNAGSIDPILILSIPSIFSISSIIFIKFILPSKSSPYEAVCIPESITSLNTGLEKFQGELIFTSQDYELNDTVSNRIIEIFENGTIIDRRMPYSEYIIDEKINKLREENRIKK